MLIAFALYTAAVLRPYSAMNSEKVKMNSGFRIIGCQFVNTALVFLLSMLVGCSDAARETNSQQTGPVSEAPLSTVYAFGGTVLGLVGEGLALNNGNGDNLTIKTNGEFKFSEALTDGADYVITVSTHPSNPSHEEQLAVDKNAGS